MRSTRYILTKLLIIILLSAGWNLPASSQHPVRRSPARPAVSAVPDKLAQRREATFRMAWETIKLQHYDPTFGGVDWDAVRDRYAPLVKLTTSDSQLHALLGKMVGELHQSHFAIIPPEDIPRFVRRRKRPVALGGKEPADGSSADETDSDEPDDAEPEGNLDLSTRMTNGIGVDLRVVDGRVLVTSVTENGPAARAGLRAGYFLRTIDDVDLEQRLKSVSEAYKNSTYINYAMRQGLLVYLLGGTAGSDVRLTYSDGDNRDQNVTLKREHLSGYLSRPLGNLPSMYTEFETQRLPGNVGYIRFSTFSPELMEKICGALRSMSDADGIVFDLRGNPGGLMGMASGISGLINQQPGLVGTLMTREGRLPLGIYPQRNPYTGPVAVLIDGLSGSSSEILAASLQESGRATVIGEQSAGVVQGADTVKLPTGAVLEFARMGFKTARGVSLEGKGVRPDIEVRLDRTALLKGEDKVIAESVKRIETVKKMVAERSATGPVSNVKNRSVSSDDEPPPPPRPLAPKTLTAPPPGGSVPGATDSVSNNSTFELDPHAAEIMERFIALTGGRDALMAITNKVSYGTTAIPLQGLTGKVVIYEEAPNRRSMETDTAGLGVMKMVFDGKRGWMQDPLIGLLEFSGPGLDSFGTYVDFYKIPEYRKRYVKIDYSGQLATDSGPVNVLILTAPNGYKEEMRFSVDSGLLVFDDGAELGDYRSVGNIKLPFRVSAATAGIRMVTTLTKIELNTTINPEAFKERADCFSQR